MSEERVSTRNTPLQQPLTRRQLVRTLAAGSMAIAGGPALAMCGAVTAPVVEAAGIPAAPAVNVTLYQDIFGGPYASYVPIMPPKDVQAKDPTAKAYAETLQTWLNQNPGVTLKHSASNTWNQQALTAAIASGTAASWYPANVLGGWDDATIHSAFVQGLAADVTTLLDRYQVNQHVSAYAKPLWAQWRVNGKYYALPAEHIPGDGIFYRRDLIKQLGLKEPEPGWTWHDLRVLAKGLTKGKRKGVALGVPELRSFLRTNGFDLLTQLPAPATRWHWRWDYTSMGSTWERLVNWYRSWVFGDGSVLVDKSLTESGTLYQVFSRGDTIAAFNVNLNYMLIPASDPTSFAALANRLGKPIGEVVGAVPLPVGEDAMFGATRPSIIALSFDPHLDPVALDKAVSLCNYMIFGRGWTDTLKLVWDYTKDPTLTWADVNVAAAVPPINGITRIPGVPVTAEDAFGKRYMDAIRQAISAPIPPGLSQYLPAEGNVGPTTVALDDAVSKWAYVPGNEDVGADLSKVQQTRNQQAASFTSTVPQQTFVAGTRAYYRAQGAFWHRYAPRFYTRVYQPWYQKNIVSVVGK